MYRIKIMGLAVVAALVVGAGLANTAAAKKTVVNLKISGRSVKVGEKIPIAWVMEPVKKLECVTEEDMEVAANDAAAAVLVGKVVRPYCFDYPGLSDRGELVRVEFTTGKKATSFFSPAFQWEGFANEKEKGPFCAYELTTAASRWKNDDGPTVVAVGEATAEENTEKSDPSCHTTTKPKTVVYLEDVEAVEEA